MADFKDQLNWLKETRSTSRPNLIGMVHLQALPGTYHSRLNLDAITKIAVEEATRLAVAGFDSILVENMHDRPYLNKVVGPEITASFTAVCAEIVRKVSVPVGIQILAGANKEALAAALASGAAFIRAESYVYGHLADEGWMDAQAGELRRYQRTIGAEHVAILTDIQKKHSSHAVSADLALEDHLEAADFFSSDGVIITGSSTGKIPDLKQLQKLARDTRLPIGIGSGMTPENVGDYAPLVDFLIVGSSLKKDGKWDNELDDQRLQAMVSALRSS